jgi:hypothetical protein
VARARLRVELAVLVLAGLASPNLCNAAAALVCDADHSRCYGSSTWSSKPDAIDEAMDKCIKSGGKCAVADTTDQPCIGWFRAPSGTSLHSFGPSYSYVVDDGTRRCEEMAGEECVTRFIYCN